MKKYLMIGLLLAVGFMFMPTFETSMLSVVAASSDVVASGPALVPEPDTAIMMTGFAMVAFGVFLLLQRLTLPGGVSTIGTPANGFRTAFRERFEVGWRSSPQQ
jgi:hypothetical protein